MKLSDLTAAFKDALANSAAIASKVQNLFGSNTYSVHAGTTSTQGIAPEDLPAFAVLAKGKDTSETASERTFDLELGCAFQQAEATTAQIGSCKVVNFPGPADMEALLDLAVQAIRTVSPNFSVDSLVCELDPLTYFPLISGMVRMTISVPHLLGGIEVGL